MKNAEKILIIISIIGLILKLIPIEGGAFLSTISFGLLGLFYLSFGFLLLNGIPMKRMFKRKAYVDMSWKHGLWSIADGIALFIAIVGFLFKLNRWEGATMLQVIGVIALLPMGVVSLIRYIQKPSNFHLGILLRSEILIFANILMMVFW